MKTFITRALGTIAVAGLAVGIMAQTHHGGMKVMTPKMPMMTKCPVCHMPLAMKKSKANPVAVRLKKGGKVMYCCAGCKMPASVLVKPKKHM